MTVASPGYVRFTQAVDLFKPLDRNKFNYRVRSGDISYVEDEHGKMYDVASIVRTKELLLKDKEKPSLDIVIDWLYADDILACLRLDKVVYNEVYLADAERYQGWLKKNHRIARAVFDARDREICYGYISLLPLPEPIIFDVLSGKLDEKDIRPEDILTYDEPGEYTLLANSAVVYPEHEEFLRRIILNLMEYWIGEAPERRIRRIYAQTVSEEGKKLAQKLFMGPFYELVGGYAKRLPDAYVLDLDAEENIASRVVREFQRRLREKMGVSTQ